MIKKMNKRKKSYREFRKLCLKCGTKTTPEISKRRFCLNCGIKYYDLICFLKKLNFNFSGGK